MFLEDEISIENDISLNKQNFEIQEISPVYACSKIYNLLPVHLEETRHNVTFNK